MTTKILVDLERCVGCWTCSMACKVGNCLDEDDFRINVVTHGSGAGIDRPQGVYPNLRMSWQPVFAKSCTFCPERLAEGELPYCAHNCPTKAIAIGDDADASGGFCQAVERVQALHYNLFESPDYADERANVVYASRE